jgi:hypothetical protein
MRKVKTLTGTKCPVTIVGAGQYRVIAEIKKLVGQFRTLWKKPDGLVG